MPRAKRCDRLQPGDRVPWLRVVVRVTKTTPGVTVDYEDGGREDYSWGSALPEVTDGPPLVVETEPPP